MNMSLAARALVEGFRIGLENFRKQLEKDAKKGDEVAKLILKVWKESKRAEKRKQNKKKKKRKRKCSGV